jgi:hypothetical protein
VAGSCECGNTPSLSIKLWGFFVSEQLLGSEEGLRSVELEG